MIVGRVAGQSNTLYADGDTQVSVLDVVLTEGDDVQSVELYNPAGIDANPLDDSSVVVSSISSAWKVAIGIDDSITPERDRGEIEIYSAALVGVVPTKKAAVRCLNDGKIEIEVLDASADLEIKGVGGDITIENSTGSFSINGSTGQVDINGNLTVDV
jgi:hypothetical protein